LTLASLLLTSTSAAIACEYIAGETKFLEYAQCRYGEDSIQTVTLPANKKTARKCSASTIAHRSAIPATSPSDIVMQH